MEFKMLAQKCIRYTLRLKAHRCGMTNLHNAVPEINTIRSQSASSGTSNVETECLFRISLILPVGWHTPARWKRSDQTQFFRIPFRDVWRVRQVRTLRARSAMQS